MPVWLYKAFEYEYPRITALEALRESMVVSVGTGNMKPADRKRMIVRWRHDAVIQEQRAPVLSAKETAQKFGFAHVEEK